MTRQKFALSIYNHEVQDAMQELHDVDFNKRLWDHDGSLWKSDQETIAKIENRLGWLDVLQTIDLDRLKALQADIKDSEFNHVVLLGMGGSSLAPEVLAQTFGNAEGFPQLLMLDSTHPAQVKKIEDSIDIKQTLFIVASKSGGTIETLSFYKYFFQKTGGNGSQFITITDPGSKLTIIAVDKGFRDTFLNPADIGGRYSALSYFGLVPAALLGIDLDRFWQAASKMMTACGKSVDDSDNPALILGATITALGLEGRDKISILSVPAIESFGNWVEQLVAESVGKEDKGFLPVVGGEIGQPNHYGSDSNFIYLRVDDDPEVNAIDAKVRALREAGHPRATLMLRDKYALAGEFFRWEYATAVAGQLLGINPFDEPNVTESKQNTGRLLEYSENNGNLPLVEPFISKDGVGLFANERTMTQLLSVCKDHRYDSGSIVELLAAQISATTAGHYFAILSYLPSTPETDDKLETIRLNLHNVSKRAVTLGTGPRYLHSTGQFHKGGPNKGVFIQLTANYDSDLAIPDASYGFAILNEAQAAGDMEALQTHKRRVLRLHLGDDASAGLDQLLDAIDFVATRKL
jgi:transaldolase / glucose-6-phosphate isomerase